MSFLIDENWEKWNIKSNELDKVKVDNRHCRSWLFCGE